MLILGGNRLLARNAAYKWCISVMLAGSYRDAPSERINPFRQIHAQPFHALAPVKKNLVALLINGEVPRLGLHPTGTRISFFPS